MYFKLLSNMYHFIVERERGRISTFPTDSPFLFNLNWGELGNPQFYCGGGDGLI